MLQPADELGLAPASAYGGEMPFAQYKSKLSPEALDAAQTAFDMAWTEIRLPEGLDEQTARNLIARRIMDSLESGESDPARLEAYALRVFKKPE